MATPLVIQIDPKDLAKNRILGVGLPFDGPAVFNKIYSTADQAKYKLLNLVLTNKGEHLYNPDFGCDIRRQLFEPLIDNIDILRTSIFDESNKYVPEVVITDIKITQDRDNQVLTISISYKMKISGQADQILINFE